METGIIMQSPTEVVMYTVAFMFVVISVTAACYASVITLVGLAMDWQKVKWIDVSFLLTGGTLVLMANFGVPSFIGHFDMTTGVVTWGIANNIWFVYDAEYSD